MNVTTFDIASAYQTKIKIWHTTSINHLQHGTLGMAILAGAMSFDVAGLFGRVSHSGLRMGEFDNFLRVAVNGAWLSN